MSQNGSGSPWLISRSLCRTHVLQSRAFYDEKFRPVESLSKFPLGKHVGGRFAEHMPERTKVFSRKDRQTCLSLRWETGSGSPHRADAKLRV